MDVFGDVSTSSSSESGFYAQFDDIQSLARDPLPTLMRFVASKSHFYFPFKLAI